MQIENERLQNFSTNIINLPNMIYKQIVCSFKKSKTIYRSFFCFFHNITNKKESYCALQSSKGEVMDEYSFETINNTYCQVFGKKTPNKIWLMEYYKNTSLKCQDVPTTPFNLSSFFTQCSFKSYCQQSLWKT